LSFLPDAVPASTSILTTTAWWSCGGHARARLGSEIVEVQAGDVRYIPPMELHQFENIGEEPFGFLCVIPNKALLQRKPSEEEG